MQQLPSKITLMELPTVLRVCRKSPKGRSVALTSQTKFGWKTHKPNTTQQPHLVLGWGFCLMLQQSAAQTGITLELKREPADGYWSNI